MVQSPEPMHRPRDSSREAILELLRTRPRTAPALADAVDISGTAIRKHLDRLTREGLVQEAGERRGRGRPATLYGLTEAGEARFRENRDQVLHSVFAALHAGADETRVRTLLRDAGTRLAQRMLHDRTPDEDSPLALVDPLETALGLLRELGGRESVRQTGDGAEIIGFVCPLAEYARDYPAVCEFVAGFTEEIVGAPVEDRCPHTGEPVCVLSVSPASP